MMTQALTLAKKPHVVIATPGRLVDHLENTKGFSLKALKYLVMDEADRILNMDFEEEVDKILRVIPRERHTYLYSATMTKKDYIHRVGRTARAGRSGKAITFVTQYDVELYQRIEHLIAKKLPLYQTSEEEVMVLMERVTEAQRFAKMVRRPFCPTLQQRNQQLSLCYEARS
ncbi:DEAD box ATP-dependent RNA helicase, putative [Ixodes scapularis]|uniref:DEAD box ATP-dependent RNA helicase, putative n=1 Tax=Ixodes scapularis TaxID=6945 RepID=B7PHP5_IXOSC|nr:DEAD box ATP-dependent RNA helicase, putative [Ixodes scapularis]|eukprot:XP_002403365.1 DEAD box ATP-dependent RNA helicase, putative [Ixodes scapularis]